MHKQEQIDLEALKPQPHPFRAILRRHKVTNIMVANYLDLHPAYVASILGGHLPMPPHQEQKLQVLVDQLEGKAV
jgi:hypothetical protein